MFRSIMSSILIMPFLLFLTGCTSMPERPTVSRDMAWVDMVLPSSLDIVEPWTSVKSFDDDDTVDGIELMLRGSNVLDGFGAVLIGDVRIELYEYLKATGNHKGKQLSLWEVKLRSGAQHGEHWNTKTEMYVFRLQVDRDKVPLTDKYILLVTYTSPLGDHLTDEIEILPRGGRRS